MYFIVKVNKIQNIQLIVKNTSPHYIHEFHELLTITQVLWKKILSNTINILTNTGVES